MELSTFAPWAAVLVALVALVRSFASDRSKAAAEKIKLLETRVDSVEDRATKIEAGLLHLPDKDVTYRLEIAMAGLKAEVGVLGERIKPVAAVSERLQEFLFEQAERAAERAARWKGAPE